MIQICKLLMTLLVLWSLFTSGTYRRYRIARNKVCYRKSFNTFNICFCFLYTVHGYRKSSIYPPGGLIFFKHF